MTKRADRIMEERCKRTGSNWRCPEKTVPGKIYCEKHYKYSISRIKRNKVKKTATVKSDSSVSATAVVEPYRPVIDFDATEVGGGSGGGNVGEIMGWLLGDTNWNDQFASCDSGSGGGRERGQGRGGGGIDDFTLGGESGSGF